MRDARHESDAIAKGAARQLGTLGSHFSRGASCDFHRSDWTFVEPGIARSTHGQFVFSVVGAAACESPPSTTCGSQPTQ